MPSADLIRESQDPSTTGARLAELAQADRALWPAIAVHPAAYPALLEWLGQQGDPTVNAVLALRSGSSAAAPAPTTPPPPPADAPAAASVPASPLGGTQPSPPAGSGGGSKNVWLVGGLAAVILLLVGGIVFGAVQVLGGDDEDTDEATTSQTSDAFCDSFKEAQNALVGDPDDTPGSDDVKAIADIFGDIESLAPAEIKDDIGTMSDYFEAMSDPSTLDTSTISERVKTFTEAGKRVSTYYQSNCM